MSILSSNHPVENQVANSISRFLSDFQVIRLFRACGCVKTKGISVEFLFAYILGNAFRSSSFYMQQRRSCGAAFPRTRITVSLPILM